jgi:hypothetical protein
VILQLAGLEVGQATHRKNNFVTRCHKDLKLENWTGHVAGMWEKRNAYMILAGTPEGKRSRRRGSRRGEDIIETALRDI